ncbi:MAG TPA: dihydroxyacetone kinase subunit DhaK [Actinomycetaceae bacterium]|nr:dihydroxyacetone kinase subunit DhaK [Actinomycetaceae bacterium]
MKKLMNDPADFVTQSVAGMVMAHSDLVSLNSTPLYVTRAGAPAAGKVGVISGGGSGHEPLHAGFVGPGMLDAAVPGPVFTSPSPDPIQAATAAVDSGAGVLHIVKNYTGDVLNFDMAKELAEAEGTEVASVLVEDDVAVEDSTYTAGRRGVAGTVLVEKIAGAAAQRGDDLASVAALATRAAQAVRSMGVALRAPVVPASGEASFDLSDDEIEVGIGIHGEPGRHRQAMAQADELTAMLLEPVVADLALREGNQVILFVNGMGATTSPELYIAYAAARRILEAHGVQVTRSLVGSYVTSLDMAGASVSVMRLDDELLELWDAPVKTIALRWGM